MRAHHAYELLFMPNTEGPCLARQVPAHVPSWGEKS